MCSCNILQSNKATISSKHLRFTWLSLPEEYTYLGREGVISDGHRCPGEITAVSQCQWKMSLSGQNIGTVSAQDFILKCPVLVLCSHSLSQI